MCKVCPRQGLNEFFLSHYYKFDDSSNARQQDTPRGMGIEAPGGMGIEAGTIPLSGARLLTSFEPDCSTKWLEFRLIDAHG